MKKLDIGLISVFVLLLVLTAASYYYIQTNTNSSALELSEGTSDLVSKQSAYISGAVNNPGVYEIQSSTTIYDLIERAGGFSNSVSKRYIEEELNLAKLVKDQDFIHIKSNSSTSGTQNSTLISINSASQAQLEELPGVGPSTALKIMEGRPYEQLSDLLNVKGIGNATFEKLKDYITL